MSDPLDRSLSRPYARIDPVIHCNCPPCSLCHRRSPAEFPARKRHPSSGLPECRRTESHNLPCSSNSHMCSKQDCSGHPYKYFGHCKKHPGYSLKRTRYRALSHIDRCKAGLNPGTCSFRFVSHTPFRRCNLTVFRSDRYLSAYCRLRRHCRHFRHCIRSFHNRLFPQYKHPGRIYNPAYTRSRAVRCTFHWLRRADLKECECISPPTNCSCQWCS